MLKLEGMLLFALLFTVLSCVSTASDGIIVGLGSLGPGKREALVLVEKKREASPWMGRFAQLMRNRQKKRETETEERFEVAKRILGQELLQDLRRFYQLQRNAAAAEKKSSELPRFFKKSSTDEALAKLFPTFFKRSEDSSSDQKPPHWKKDEIASILLEELADKPRFFKKEAAKTEKDENQKPPHWKKDEIASLLLEELADKPRFFKKEAVKTEKDELPRFSKKDVIDQILRELPMSFINKRDINDEKKTVDTKIASDGKAVK